MQNELVRNLLHEAIFYLVTIFQDELIFYNYSIIFL